MPIAYGKAAEVPWLDNWPIDIQLWAYTSQAPGDELDLTPASKTIGGVSVPRSLTVRWKDKNNAIALSSTSLISIIQSVRGIVRVVPTQALWDKIRSDETYTLEVWAYGILYHTQTFSPYPPQATSFCVNGVLLYAAPREVLEVLGSVPGASSYILASKWILE